MPQIEVRRLLYRGEPSQAARVEHAISDALRTETTNDGRLILVRRMPLGRIGADQRGAARAAASAWRDLVGCARHGGESGAESANCVWFASPAEARALILRELARGRTPFAWFWALAVPDWRRMTLAQYLDHRLRLALAEPSGKAIAALVDEAVAAEASETLATAMLAMVPGGPGPKPLPADPPTLARDAHSAPPAAALPGLLAEGGFELTVALGVLRAVPPQLRAVLERLADHPRAASIVRALADGLVQRRHPALALEPRRQHRLSLLVVELLHRGGETYSRGSRDSLQGTVKPAGSPFGEVAREPKPADSPDGEEARQQTVPAEPESPAAPRTPPDNIERPVTAAGHESLSCCAGVFLAVVPLIRLGGREWLAARPDLLLHQPGARLLHAIVRHYRVPPDDAVWSALPQLHHDTEPPAELATALALWRKGLDGWLRHTARLNLAQLVLRRGWLLAGADSTIVRFPLDSTDIRLRRLALDSDPGWVDWLGHSYRLVYGDRPLTGPHMP